MSLKIRLIPGAANRISRDLLLPVVRKTGERIERQARSTVRVKSGAVRASISSNLKVTNTRITYTVSASHRRAMLEHEGAKPHAIEQKPGGPMLHFFWDKVGHEVWFHSVKHPGTKGSKFLTGPLMKVGTRNGFAVTIKP